MSAKRARRRAGFQERQRGNIVTQVGSTSKSGAASGASCTVPLPNTATLNNLLVVILTGTGSGVRTLSTINGVAISGGTASGWTVRQSGSDAGSSAGQMWVLTKIAAGGETSVALAWTGGNMVPGWRAKEFTNVDITTPILAAPAFQHDISAGTTLTPAARTTANANEAQLAFGGGRGKAGGLDSHSFGGGFTEADAAGTGVTAVCYDAFRNEPVAGTVVNPTFTFTNLQGSPVTLFGYLSIKAA